MARTSKPFYLKQKCEYRVENRRRKRIARQRDFGDSSEWTPGHESLVTQNLTKDTRKTSFCNGSEQKQTKISKPAKKQNGETKE